MPRATPQARTTKERSAELTRKLEKHFMKGVRLNIEVESLIKSEHRKASRHKYEIGGLAVMTGADELGKTVLTGIFHRLAEADVSTPEKKDAHEKLLSSLSEVGERRLQLAERDRQAKADAKARDNPPIEVRVTFPEAPPNIVRSVLKVHVLTYNQTFNRWEGFVPKMKIKKLHDKITSFGGTFMMAKSVYAELGLRHSQ